MSKLILALTALTLGVSRITAAQSPYVGSAAHTADVGGVQIQRAPRYHVRKPFEAPKPRVERTGRAPSSRAVWVPGFWDLRGNPMAGLRAGWIWVPGRWAVPPQHGMHWNAAHWGWQDESWSWIPGHWVRRAAGGLVSAGHPFP